MELYEVRRSLSAIQIQVLLQWVPGYCDLIGNEWADVEAGEAAAGNAELCNDVISFNSTRLQSEELS